MSAKLPALPTPVDYMSPDIPPHVGKELTHLFTAWKLNKKIGEHIDRSLSNAINPYEYTIELLYYGVDSNKTQMTPFTMAIHKEFEKWLIKNPSAHLLTLPLKNQALEMMLKRGSSFFIQSVCKTFELDKNIDDLKPLIDYYIDLKHHIQCCSAIAALRMQGFYAFEKVVFPILCQNKIHLVHEYFFECRDLQIQFAIAVDSICESSETVRNWMSDLDVVCGNKSFRSDLKWLLKFLSSFLKKFNIPIDTCPNLIRTRCNGAINFLIQKRFTEQTMSDEAWKEMVMATSITDDVLLQNELLTKLIRINQMNLAKEMADLLQVPVEARPEELQQERPTFFSSSDDNSHYVDNDFDEDYSDVASSSEFCTSSNYLTLRLDESDIILVDSVEKFQLCVEDISKSYDVAGIDAEWRPSMGIAVETISVLQIAIWENVYLLDMVTLLDKLETKHWNDLINKFFLNPNILKLGYGIFTDLDMLKDALRSRIPEIPKFSHVLDVGQFFQVLPSMYPHLDLYHKASLICVTDSPKCDSKGLSRLCETVLGKPLNKIEQFSDWRKRPLRQSQIIYAALDAFCLLQIFENLYHTMHKVGLKLHNVIMEFYTKAPKLKLARKSPSKSKPKLNKVSPVKQNSTPEKSPISVSQFKVVVDDCLHGLGKQLRLRGANVLIMGDRAHPDELVKAAIKEDRLVMSSGSRYERIKRHINPEMVFNVPQALSAAEQAALVCKHFSVVCTESDIFSRCTLCNCDNYLKISSEDMQLLWAMRKTSVSPPQAKQSDLIPFVVTRKGFVTEEGIMHTGKEVQMSGLSSEILLKGYMFFVCSNCGKVYWEGSHHRNTRKMVSDWIEQWNIDEPNNKEKESESDVIELVSVLECSGLEDNSDVPSVGGTLGESSASVEYIGEMSDYDDDYDPDDLVYS